MIAGRRLGTIRTRVAIGAVVALALAGIGIVPRVAQAANTVSVDPATPQEGNFGTPSFDVTFRLSNTSTSTVSVQYTTVDGTAKAASDYVAQSGTVTFAPGDTTQQVTFHTRGDVAFEGDETFTIDLGTVTGGGFSAGSDGLVTIQNDDLAPTVDVTAPPPVEEGNTNNPVMNFTATLSKPSGSQLTYYAFTANPRDPSEIPPVANAPRPATESPNTKADYTSKDGFAVVFAPNTTTASIPVTILSDTRDEFDEFIELQLKATNDASAADLDFATGQIVDDDAPARLDVSDPVAVDEGNTPCGHLGQPACTTKITFTVTLNGLTDKTVIVDYATEDRSATSGSSDPNADYIAESGSGDPSDGGSGLRFVPGDTQEQVTVDVRGDTTAEPDEIFAFVLSNPVNATLGDETAFGTISNDDGGSFPTVSVSNAPAEPESSGGTPGTSTFTINVSRPTLNTSNVEVCYATADGPETSTGAAAVAGSDYTAVNDCTTINFPNSSTTVEVPLINDSRNEPDEFFQLQILSAGNAAITDAVGEAKITDEDPAPTVSIDNATVAEGTGTADTPGNMSIKLSAPSGQPVTVNYETLQPNAGTASATGDTADYKPVKSSVTFAPGETTKTITIPVIADAVDENSETVRVNLTSVSGAGTADGVGDLTITDDDNPPTITIGNVTHTEGSEGNTTATLPVTLSNVSSKVITVNVATANGTATATTTSNAGDYVSKTETLTFNPGEKTKDFNVTVIADTVDEANETFTATLSSPNENATLGSPSTGTATIADDDDPPALSINNATVAEGNSGTTNATFTVTLAGGTAQTVTVHYATVDGSATVAGNDYTATSGDLTFAPGDTSKTINVPVKGDTTVEPDEGFTVKLTSPTSGATLADDTGNGTITNDDSVPPSTSSTTTTTTTIPAGAAPRITTGPGPGGGPHIKVFNANGTGPGVQFMDGNTSNTGGKRVARGDLNGDGVDEIITGSGPNAAAVVSAYSASGTLLGSSFAYANGSFFGGIFVAAGDVDGDGKDEIITSPGPGGGPHVRTWDLTSSGLVGSSGFMAYGGEFTGGVTVASGDVNNDGKDDIVTGPGAGGGPHVRVFNGANNAELFGLMAYTGPNGQPNWTGGINVAAGDLDGDGKSEIAVAPWQGGGPHLKLFNHDGSLRSSGIMAGNPNFTGGITVAMGNLTGDDKAEILVGAMNQVTAVQAYKADLTKLGDQFLAYPGFGGGVFIAIGTA